MITLSGGDLGGMEIDADGEGWEVGHVQEVEPGYRYKRINATQAVFVGG